MNDAILRPLTVFDAALLAELHRTSFADFWDEAAFASLLAMQGAFGLLALADQPCGFILCRSAADEAEILTIAIVPPQRRKGIAALLLAESEVVARGRGVTRFFLEVAEDNDAARPFYEKGGFAEVGRRKLYYRGKIDALLLKKGL